MAEDTRINLSAGISIALPLSKVRDACDDMGEQCDETTLNRLVGRINQEFKVMYIDEKHDTLQIDLGGTCDVFDGPDAEYSSDVDGDDIADLLDLFGLTIRHVSITSDAATSRL
jgi:hypothetical protein